MNVDLLVLDEPTASLPTADVERLFNVLRYLRERGVAMIYVTHRMDEVFRIVDRVAVMREGPLGGKGHRADIDRGIGECDCRKAAFGCLHSSPRAVLATDPGTARC
jgi:ABC-type sugar transport system ATPase subunit